MLVAIFQLFNNRFSHMASATGDCNSNHCGVVVYVMIGTVAGFTKSPVSVVLKLYVHSFYACRDERT